MVDAITIASPGITEGVTHVEIVTTHEHVTVQTYLYDGAVMQRSHKGHQTLNRTTAVCGLFFLKL